MNEITTFAGLAERKESIAGVGIIEKEAVARTQVCPRPILRSAQIELIDGAGPSRSKKRKVKFRGAILGTKIKTKRVLRIVRRTAESAADPDTRILLKASCAVRQQQF